MRELSDSDLEMYAGKDVASAARSAIDKVDSAADSHRQAARDVTSLSARLSRQVDDLSSQMKSLMSSAETNTAKK